jgi:hypothetical protein
LREGSAERVIAGDPIRTLVDLVDGSAVSVGNDDISPCPSCG